MHRTASYRHTFAAGIMEHEAVQGDHGAVNKAFADAQSVTTLVKLVAAYFVLPVSVGLLWTHGLSSGGTNSLYFGKAPLAGFFSGMALALMLLNSCKVPVDSRDMYLLTWATIFTVGIPSGQYVVGDVIGSKNGLSYVLYFIILYALALFASLLFAPTGSNVKTWGGFLQTFMYGLLGPMQAAFAMTWGQDYSAWSIEGKLLICVFYPFLIQIIKVVILKLSTPANELTGLLISLSWAAMPYRFLQNAMLLEGWNLVVAVMCYELLYKCVVVYAKVLQVATMLHQYALEACDFVTTPSKKEGTSKGVSVLFAENGVAAGLPNVDVDSLKEKDASKSRASSNPVELLVLNMSGEGAGEEKMEGDADDEERAHFSITIFAACFVHHGLSDICNAAVFTIVGYKFGVKDPLALYGTSILVSSVALFAIPLLISYTLSKERRQGFSPFSLGALTVHHWWLRIACFNTSILCLLLLGMENYTV